MATLRTHGKIEQLRALFWQLVRFGLTGGAATAIYAAVYWPIATYAQVRWPIEHRSVWPLIANVLGYLVSMVAGYVIHSRWSFRDVGARDNVSRTGGRFLVVTLVSFALNTFFVWFLTGPMHGATWWPLVTNVFVTPMVTFVLYRFWVFA